MERDRLVKLVKARKVYVSRKGQSDEVCPLVCVRVTGMADATHYVRGVRSRSLMVPECKVSEVFDVVQAAFAGISEKSVDSEEGNA